MVHYSQRYLAQSCTSFCCGCPSCCRRSTIDGLIVLSLVKNTSLTARLFQQMRQDDMDREQYLTAEFLGQASFDELVELSRWY